MARRITDYSAGTLMSFRISPKMKVDVDKYADIANVSSAAWIRSAIDEKIQRMKKEAEEKTREIKSKIPKDELVRVLKELKKEGFFNDL